MRAAWLMVVLTLPAAMPAPARGAEAAPAEASVVARLDRALQASQRREQHAEALKICEEIAASRAEPKDKAAALEIMVDVLRQQQKFLEAAAVCERMRKAVPDDKAAEQKSYFLQADMLRQAKKEADAAAALREFLGRQPDNKAGGAEARLRLAECLLATGKNAEAYEEAAKAADAGTLDDKRAGEALWWMVEAAWRGGQEMEKAAAALQRLLEPKVLARRDVWIQKEIRVRYGQCLRKLKRYDEARAHYAAMEKAETDARQVAEWIVAEAETFLEEGRDDDALKTCERVFLERPDSADQWYGTQRKIVELLTKKGRLDEALKAARIALDASRDEAAVVENVRTIAEILKGIDKHVGRANAFIHYQRYGPAGPDAAPGTGDDLKDPLADIAYPSYPEREKALAEARRRAGDDAKAMRFRAMTYLYCGKPREALRCFLDAFARATGEDFQAMGHDLILIGVRAARGHPAGLDAFFQFINYGPAGPDGKAGTADDLADPFAPLLK